MITILCLGSGGINGISITSALKYLNEQNYIDFNKIKTYSCVSVGSIIGILLIVGYNINEIYDIIKEKIDYDEITPEFSLDLLLEKCGFDNGDKIINYLKKKISYKINNTDINFLELYNLTKIKFIIATTNYTQNKEKIFNYKDTPHVPVMLAIRMSISIPIIYTPILYENNYYMDGAIINKVYIPKNSNPENTLVIYLSKSKTTKNITIKDLIINSIEIMTDQMVKYDIYKYNCLIIKSINVVSCSNYRLLTDENIKKLLLNGRLSAKKYLINKLKKEISNKITCNK